MTEGGEEMPHDDIRDTRGPNDPRDERRPRRMDWDVRGVLAILSILGVFTLAGAKMYLTGLDAEVPAWAATLVGAVAGFYFGSRGGGTNGYK